MDEIQRYELAINRARLDGNDAAAQELQQRLNQLLAQQQGQQADQYLPQEPKASDTISAMQRSLKERLGVTVPEGVISSLVGIGKGYTDVVEGVKTILGQGKDPSDATEWARFEEEYPVSAIGGRVVGQAAPFAALGPLAAGARAGGAAALGKTVQPLSRGARIAAGAGTGAAEGGIITAGATDEARQEEIIGGAGLGGIIGAGVEVAFPHIGSLINRLRSKPLLKGDQLSSEAQAAMEAVGMSADEIEKVKPVLQKIRVNPNEQLVGQDLERILRFESMGVPYTRGDVLGTGTQEGFEQRVMESRLLESSTDELAQPLRDVKRAQSATIQDLLETQVKKLGGADSKEAGEALKDALLERKGVLRENKTQLYKKLAEEAKNAPQIPVNFTGRIDWEKIDDIGVIEETAVNRIKNRLLKFGIGDPDEVARFAQNEEVTPVTIESAERLRKFFNSLQGENPRLNALSNELKSALDAELDVAINALSDAGVDVNVGEIAKQARAANVKLAQEFSPQSIVGKLTGTKKDRVTEIVEASDVMRSLFPTKARPKTENIKKVVGSLMQAGDKGRRALNNMQGATIQRLIDRGFSQQSNRVGEQVLFSGNQFAKAFDEFGEENLEAIFSNNKPLLNKLNRMRDIADDLTIDSKTVPKGSASTMIYIADKLASMFAASKLGIPIAGGVEGFSSLMKKSELRNKAKSVGKNGPRYTPKELRQIRIIRDTMPEMATALGITATLETEDE